MPGSTTTRSATTNNAHTLRLALVNDFPLVVQGLAAALAARTQVEIVEIDTSRKVVREVDLILYDTFGHVGGLDDFIAGATAPVVVFSFTHEAIPIAEAKAAGAAGFLSKTLAIDELVAALERCLTGEFVVALGVPQADPDADPGPATNDWPGKSDGLTYRESEILALICQGLSNDDIAKRLYLSINSIKTYIRTGYRKMRVTSRSQAVLWGLAHGFLPEELRQPPLHQTPA